MSCVCVARKPSICFAERRGWSRLAKLPTDASFLKLLKQSHRAHKLEFAEDLLQLFRSPQNSQTSSPVLLIEKTLSRNCDGRWPEAEKGIV